MPSFSFDRPLALLLLLVLPLLPRLARGALRSLPGPQRAAVLRLRLAITALLALALAQPALGIASPRLAVVFALDGSASLTPQQQAWARDWVRRAAAQMQPQDRWAAIEFGARAELLGPDLQPAADLPRDATDQGAALRLARSLLPPDGPREIVLLGDGWDTAAAGPLELPPGGSRVSYVLPGAPGVAPEVALQRLDVPPSARVGEALDVAGTLASTQPQQVTLRLRVDGQPVLEQAVAVPAGVSHVPLPVRLRAVGFHALRL